MSGHLPPEQTVLSAALSYGKRGWAVIPLHGIREGQCTCGNAECSKPGKHPRTEHGLLDATTNESQIREWWAKWPNANIGHPTGRRVVLDADGPEGEAALAELQAKHSPLPETLTARTGRGRHLYFAASGAKVRNSAGKLGPHLDVRGEGGYVILPPSVHVKGKRYEWVDPRIKPAPLPAWFGVLLVEFARPRTDTKSADAKIPHGQRNAYLTSLAGSMRRSGATATAIEAALLQENKLRCDPPLAESEVRRTAQSVGRYDPATKTEAINPWAAAENMDTFLTGGDDDAEFLDDGRRFLARECVTEIFSPRGLGKSLFALWLAVLVASRRLRVLYIDRDNPRRVMKNRLWSFGATLNSANLKVTTREKCPPLTNTPTWASFPYDDYDVVILDSLDSAAEGVGEQDSAKLSRAIAPLLDIARREKGPAVLILGNTIKSAAHSRGSGVIEDRSDIVYEVRDASELKLSGSKPWWEELPPADAGSWAARSSRRKQKAKYRLAFIASKFRIAEEPEPFILEINTSGEPWTVEDVTDRVDTEGAQAREQRASEKRGRVANATAALVVEIGRRAEAGEPPLAKRRDAEGFLIRQGLKRAEARECLGTGDGTSWVLSRLDGRMVVVLPLGGKKEESGHVFTLTEPAKTAAKTDVECGRPVSIPPATSDTPEGRINGGYGDSENVADGSTFTPPSEGECVAAPKPVEVDKRWRF